MQTKDIAQEIDRLLESGNEFGIAIFPGENVPHFFGSGMDSGELTMEIVPWLGRFADRIIIGAPGRPEKKTPEPVAAEGITRNEYLSAVSRVIESCRRRNGKTVYSRIITGTKPRLGYGEIARRLFKAYPATLRFIYNTPETGCWMGATPELLFDFDSMSGEVRTMSFAGTRAAGTAVEWDEKNAVENRFVTDYIVESLQKLGMAPSVSASETVRYGSIEHLCHRISAKNVTADAGRIADALNPTPALCGWPLTDAVNDIRRYERHDRRCYGGFVGFSSKGKYTAYVNLRSMQFSPKGYCIFGGGGITGSSIAEEEFAETEAKTALLQELTGNAVTNKCNV